MVLTTCVAIMGGTTYWFIARSEPSLRESIRAGMNWALGQRSFQPGDLWVLSQIDDARASHRARQTIERYQGRLGPFEGLLRSGFDGGEPPEEWSRLEGNPYARIGVWLFHAGNYPARRPPEAVVEELMEGRYSDYLLAHQYVALRILFDRGAVTGERVEAALADLLDRMEAEQREDEVFSDLHAERVALLLHGGRRPQALSAWIARILDHQEKDGRWETPPHPYPTRIEDLHTTLLCLWALDQYQEGSTP